MYLPVLFCSLFVLVRRLSFAGPRASLHFKPKEVRAALVTCGGLCPGLNSVIHHLVLTLLNIYDAEKVRALVKPRRGVHPMASVWNSGTQRCPMFLHVSKPPE